MNKRFDGAEQLWFWFMYSKSVRNEFAKNKSSNGKRVCEVMDIELLVTKLYLCGKLTEQQLEVMKEFGDKRRVPNKYIWSENRKSHIWNNAMDVLETAAVKLGWIDTNQDSVMQPNADSNSPAAGQEHHKSQNSPLFPPL